jgi:hypothetical protein
MSAVLTRMLPSSLQDAYHLDRPPGPWHEGGVSDVSTQHLVTAPAAQTSVRVLLPNGAP